MSLILSAALLLGLSGEATTPVPAKPVPDQQAAPKPGQVQVATSRPVAPVTSVVASAGPVPAIPPEAQAQRIPMAALPMKVTPSDAPFPGKPVRYVRVPMNSARIDKKKPYMRVYYWPPLPPQGEDGPSPVTSANSGPLDYGMNLDPVYFPFNTSDMVAPATHLQRIANWVRTSPVNHLTVTGHADPRGTKTRNENLSAERAVIVKDALVKLGAPSNQIATEGMGARRPVKRGKTQESHNWGSRRVEFTLHRPKEGVAPVTKPRAKAEAEPLAPTVVEGSEKAKG